MNAHSNQFVSTRPESFSAWKTLILVCCAAIAIMLPYIVLSLANVLPGFPNIVIFSIAALIGSLVFQLGYILMYTRKHYGDFCISKSLGLQTKLGWKKLVIWVPILLVVVMGLFAATQLIGVWLQSAAFSWLPSWYPLETDYSIYSINVQYITYAVMFVIVGIIVPVVEEVFFRGFLMLRMGWAGKWVVPANVVLFAAYHIWSPWQFVTRLIAMLPLYYVTYKKNNIQLAIIVHCCLNLLADVIVPVVMLLAST